MKCVPGCLSSGVLTSPGGSVAGFALCQKSLAQIALPAGSLLQGLLAHASLIRAKKASSLWCKGRSLEFRGTTLIPAAAGS